MRLSVEVRSHIRIIETSQFSILSKVFANQSQRISLH
jgi:hypothetical protein